MPQKNHESPELERLREKRDEAELIKWKAANRLLHANVTDMKAIPVKQWKAEYAGLAAEVNDLSAIQLISDGRDDAESCVLRVQVPVQRVTPKRKEICLQY